MDADEYVKTVWVFNGEYSRLPSGIFSTKESAVRWIEANGLSGTLSEFPIDVGTYDHAIQNGLFTPKKLHESEPGFIASFSPRLYHDHWTDGKPFG